MDKKIRVLIVEDEYLIALSFKRELESIGYEVFEPIATGQIAIEIARQKQPDIILMDRRLAGMVNGLDAAREIITTYGIPVIIMTGHSDDKTMEQIKQLNAVAYLIKPILGTDIHAAIQKYFQSREQ